MDPTIRHVTSEELPAFITAMNAAYLEHNDAEKVAAELRTIWDLDRVWSAFEDGRLVGTFRSHATELTVPGCGRVPGSAIAAVTVMPDRRRKGILRRMVAAEHAAARERGEVVALLYAAEYPIYGRFGYGPACAEATWRLDAMGAEFHGAPGGSVEIASADEATRDAMIGVFGAWRARSVGEIARRDHSWDFDLALRTSAWSDPAWKGFVALHRDLSGVVDGYARYHAEGDHWERRQPRNTIIVDDMHALDAAAYADLWRLLAGLDWVASVRAEHRSPSEPLPWLLVNGRAASVDETGDGLWVRLLDVPRALAARTYERDGSVVLEVVDGESVGGRSRYVLEAGPDGATCAPTDRSPELTLDVAALGAAYLGGSRLRDAVRVRGWDEHRPGALAATDKLFATIDDPWCSTFF
jgi:predicted acetyltransferase